MTLEEHVEAVEQPDGTFKARYRSALGTVHTSDASYATDEEVLEIAIDGLEATRAADQGASAQADDEYRSAWLKD